VATLTSTIMRDGSRCFLALPAAADWYAVKDHVARLGGAELTGFLTDQVTECWIDFRYSGHEFSVNDQFGDYWFFVKNAACPIDLLKDVAAHFSALLGVANE
jgi:hypothetical protein